MSGLFLDAMPRERFAESGEGGTQGMGPPGHAYSPRCRRMGPRGGFLLRKASVGAGWMDDLAQLLESLGAGGMAQPTAAPSLTLTVVGKFWVPWRRELTGADTLLSGEATMTRNNNSGPWFCGLSLPGNVKSSDLSSPRQKCCAAPGAIALKTRSDNPRMIGHEGGNVLSFPHPQILAFP